MLEFVVTVLAHLPFSFPHFLKSHFDNIAAEENEECIVSRQFHNGTKYDTLYGTTACREQYV